MGKEGRNFPPLFLGELQQFCGAGGNQPSSSSRCFLSPGPSCFEVLFASQVLHWSCSRPSQGSAGAPGLALPLAAAPQPQGQWEGQRDAGTSLPQDCDSFRGSRSCESGWKEHLEGPSLGTEMGNTQPQEALVTPGWWETQSTRGSSTGSAAPQKLPCPQTLPGSHRAPAVPPGASITAQERGHQSCHSLRLPQPLCSSTSPRSGLEKQSCGAGTRTQPWSWSQLLPPPAPRGVPVVGGIPPGTPRV